METDASLVTILPPDTREIFHEFHPQLKLVLDVSKVSLIIY